MIISKQLTHKEFEEVQKQVQDLSLNGVFQFIFYTCTEDQCIFTLKYCMTNKKWTLELEQQSKGAKQ